MVRLTLQQKANRANAKSQACATCSFQRLFNEDICSLCRKAFNEGYLKGYKQAKKDEQLKAKANG